MRGSILLVEDDLDLLGYYELLLELEGFRVWGACPTGEAALALYRDANAYPDAIVLDHRLPGKSGLEVARIILELDPDAGIVLATADDRALEEARRLGIRRFAVKPFDNERLLRALDEVVAERRASRERHGG